MNPTGEYRARVRQWLRCSTPLGHFYKWRLGDGEHCPWCRFSRRFPRLGAWLRIPYSYDDVTDIGGSGTGAES